MTKYTLVTNNPDCLVRYGDSMEVVFDPDWTYLEVLLQVRALVGQGLLLATHPMAGSLKPNQTPYRSVLLADQTMEDKEPFEDVRLVEQGIACCETFLRCRALPHYPPEIQRDFRTLDLSFLEGALRCAGLRQ